MKLALIALCLMPGMACRAQYARTRRNYDESFLSVPAIGPVSMTNARLNQWISEHGGTPANNLLACDFLTMMEEKHGWDFGMSVGIIGAANNGTLSVLYCDIAGGYRVFGSHFFRSRLLFHGRIYEASIRGTIPSSIVSPAPHDFLHSTMVGCGISNLNTFKIFSWTGCGVNQSLSLGVEYGVEVVSGSNWKFGHYVGSGKHRHFVGVPVSEVPNFDPVYKYLKFSLTWNF